MSVLFSRPKIVSRLFIISSIGTNLHVIDVKVLFNDSCRLLVHLFLGQGRFSGGLRWGGSSWLLVHCRQRSNKLHVPLKQHNWTRAQSSCSDDVRQLPVSLLLARSLLPPSCFSVMLATRRTEPEDPLWSRSRLRSSFSRLKLRLVSGSRCRSSRLSSRRSKRSPPRSERSKCSLRSRLELFLLADIKSVCSRRTPSG